MDCAAQVTSIAAALYLGYLDAATRISQSGGGGGSPGTGWGKRDDEDDLAFRQRCFFMALHMMRPAQKQQRKREPHYDRLNSGNAVWDLLRNWNGR